MQETTLKKEFSKSDVQRMRNIISNKSQLATKIQIGYSKKSTIRSEGDTWEESGKIWTIKNGIKQSVTKLDSYKKLVVLPLACPKCKGHMKINDLNKTAYANYNVCFNCAIELETDKKILGTFSEEVQAQNALEFLKSLDNFELELDDWFSSKEDNFVNEQGDIENWLGGNKASIYQKAKEEIQKAKQSIKLDKKL